jgi:hypothetical protein
MAYISPFVIVLILDASVVPFSVQHAKPKLHAFESKYLIFGSMKPMKNTMNLIFQALYETFRQLAVFMNTVLSHGFHKMRGTSFTDEVVFASQVKATSTKLVTRLIVY